MVCRGSLPQVFRLPARVGQPFLGRVALRQVGEKQKSFFLIFSKSHKKVRNGGKSGQKVLQEVFSCGLCVFRSFLVFWGCLGRRWSGLGKVRAGRRAAKLAENHFFFENGSFSQKVVKRCDMVGKVVGKCSGGLFHAFRAFSGIVYPSATRQCPGKTAAMCALGDCNS